MWTYVMPWLKHTGVVYSPPYHCPYNSSELKAELKGFVPVLTHYGKVHDFMPSLNGDVSNEYVWWPQTSQCGSPDLIQVKFMWGLWRTKWHWEISLPTLQFSFQHHPSVVHTLITPFTIDTIYLIITIPNERLKGLPVQWYILRIWLCIILPC